MVARAQSFSSAFTQPSGKPLRFGSVLYKHGRSEARQVEHMGLTPLHLSFRRRQVSQAFSTRRLGVFLLVTCSCTPEPSVNTSIPTVYGFCARSNSFLHPHLTSCGSHRPSKYSRIQVAATLTQVRSIRSEHRLPMSQLLAVNLLSKKVLRTAVSSAVDRTVCKKHAPRQDLRVLQRPSLKYLSPFILVVFINYNFVIIYFKALKLLIKSLYYKILNVFINCN